MSCVNDSRCGLLQKCMVSAVVFHPLFGGERSRLDHVALFELLVYPDVAKYRTYG